MTENQLNHMLIEYFPELTNKFIEETSWQDDYDTGSTVVYADVFFPFILEKLKCKDENTLTRIFDFIEMLSKCGDEYAEYVIGISIIDNFHFYNKKLGYEKYFKENTRHIYNS